MSDDNFDFGFTAVEEPNYDSVPQSSVTETVTNVTKDFRDEVMAKLLDIEGRILNADSSDMVNEHRTLVEQDVANKLKQLEDLILPLLFNLQKNPDKEYIHWPNRTAIIDKQIEKIKAVTRYYERL
jgi:hypothetical protein